MDFFKETAQFVFIQSLCIIPIIDYHKICHQSNFYGEKQHPQLDVVDKLFTFLLLSKFSPHLVGKIFDK